MKPFISGYGMTNIEQWSYINIFVDKVVSIPNVAQRMREMDFIPNRVDIDQCPEEVGQKLRFGDLEIDTIIDNSHKGAILTINDRARAGRG